MIKNDIVKLIYQYCTENGLDEVGKALKKESNAEIESPFLSQIKEYITEDNFDKAIHLIEVSLTFEQKTLIIPQILLYQIFKYHSKNKSPTKTVKLIRKLSSCVYDKNKVISKCAYLLFDKNDKNKTMKNDTFIHSNNLKSLFEYISTVLSNSKNENIKTLHPQSLIRMMSIIEKNQIERCKYHNIIKETKSLGHCCEEDLIPSKQLLIINTNNSEEIVSLSMNPSKDLLAVLFNNDYIKIYKISYLSNKILQFELIRKYNDKHKSQITSLQMFSQDMLLTSSKDKTVKITEISTNKTEQLNFSDMILSSIAFTALDGIQRLAFASHNQMVYIYNTKDKLYQNEKVIDRINQICFSLPTSSLIFSCPSNQSVMIYDISLTERRANIYIKDTILSMGISKDGYSLLINSSNTTPVISLYDIVSKTMTKYFGHRQLGLCNQCRFGGANENFIIAGGCRKVTIWRKGHTIPVKTIEGFSDLSDVVWENKDLIISSGNDGVIRIFGNKYLDGAVLKEQKDSSEENNNMNEAEEEESDEYNNQSDLDESEESEDIFF